MKRKHIYEKFRLTNFLGLLAAGLINAFGVTVFLTPVSRRRIIRTSVLKVKRKFILCQNTRQYSKYWLRFFLV